MKIPKLIIIFTLFAFYSYYPLSAQKTDTLFVFPREIIGKIYPTYHRLNIWDLTHTFKFPEYPHHKYPFVEEANLMSSTGGRSSNEMFDINGNHNFSVLGKAIQNLLDSGIKPIIVVGNIPESLSDLPGEKGYFNTNIGKPVNYMKYYEYVVNLFDYLAITFPSLIRSFEFRLYTEPDFYVWFNNGLEEYKKIYDFTLAAMRKSLKKLNYSPILHPGNFMAPSKSSDTSSLFYPWTIAIAKWLKDDYKGKFIETFDSDLFNWDVQGKVKINELNELSLSDGRILSKISKDWLNFDLRFNLKLASDNSKQSDLGIMFNYRDDNNYYLLQSSLGETWKISLSVKKNGIMNRLDSILINFPKSKYYKFEILSSLDNILLKINNKPILSVPVENKLSGTIGFFKNDGKSDIFIDDIIVCNYHYITNFEDKEQWKIRGNNKFINKELILNNAEAILDSKTFSNYKVNVKMKTGISGEEGEDVGWLIFDYLDSNNFNAFVLNYHGYVEFIKIINGNAVTRKSSWTGLPKPYFSANFTETPEEFLTKNLKSNRIENGVLCLKNGLFLTGFSNPFFCYEYRIKAKIRTETPKLKSGEEPWIIFNFKDSLNYYGLQLRNDKERTLVLKRKFKGQDSIIFSVSSGTKSDGFDNFDIRVGGDIESFADRESWNPIENNITVFINGKKIISSVYQDENDYGKIGFLSKDTTNTIYIDDYLITYEGDSRGISPLDYHNFELISDDFIKILSIDGITYAVFYDLFPQKNGGIGFRAHNSKGIHIRDLSVSEILPVEAGSLPRMPKVATPRFSYSYYAQLNPSDENSIGSNPKDIKTITNELRNDVKPYFENAIFEVAEAGLYLDEDGIILSNGDGTELGAAWNAAIYKNSLDAGLESFSQWGYTSEELKSPTYNLFEIIEMLKDGSRVLVSQSKFNDTDNFDAIASKSNDSILLLIYNFNPKRNSNQFSRSFVINIRDLPINQTFILEEIRIDSTNSNFFSKWLEYCERYNIKPMPGKSKFDMNIAGAYDSEIIQNHWKKQKEYFKSQNYDSIRSIKIEVQSSGDGKINLPLVIPGNGVIFLRIYTKK